MSSWPLDPAGQDWINQNDAQTREGKVRSGPRTPDRRHRVWRPTVALLASRRTSRSSTRRDDPMAHRYAPTLNGMRTMIRTSAPKVTPELRGPQPWTDRQRNGSLLCLARGMSNLSAQSQVLPATGVGCEPKSSNATACANVSFTFQALRYCFMKSRDVAMNRALRSVPPASCNRLMFQPT